MARLGRGDIVAEMSVKSSMSTSLAPFVNGDGRKLNVIGRPRRFYVDDILAPDFGRGSLEEGSLEPICENHWTVTDEAAAAAAAAANPGDHPNIAIQLINGTASELNKPTCGLARPTAEALTTSQAPPSSFVTLSRRFHDNDTSAGSGNSADCSGRTAMKHDITTKRCNSTGRPTEATADTNTAGSISDVTSSTTSHPGQMTKKPGIPGWKADSKNSFTLPAWVYCTRYSDRPSAGNYQQYTLYFVYLMVKYLKLSLILL